MYFHLLRVLSPQLSGMIGTFVFVQYERNAIVIYGLFIQSQCFNLAGSQLREVPLSFFTNVSVTVFIFRFRLAVSHFHSSRSDSIARVTADTSPTDCPT